MGIDAGASADVVDGMSVALAAVVHNYDKAKQALQEILTAFNSAVPNFPEKVNVFRQLYPAFTLGTKVSTLSNTARDWLQMTLVEAYKAVISHEHCFKLLSVPSILRNLCFLSKQDFEALQMSVHPAESLLAKADVYPRLRHCEPEVAKELAFNLISFNRSFSIQRLDEVHQVSTVSDVQCISLT